jgi:transposase
LSVAVPAAEVGCRENLLVAKDFRHPDRDQSFLLPPDMRQWLPPGHLVWWLIEVVEALDVSAFEMSAKLGRAGRRPFAPRTLLAILIYGYALGERSSRQLERLCQTDVAFRVLAGNGSGTEAPDHATLARFRQRHDSALEGLFLQVLVLCARAGLGRLGMIAVDGTKIAANASKQANMTEDRLRDELARTVSGILRDAEDVDAAEDAEFGEARGDELPLAMVPGPERKARIKAILDQLDADRAAETAAAEQISEQQAERVADYLARLADPVGPGQVGAGPAGVDRVAVAQLRLQREIRNAEQRVLAHQAKAAAAAQQGRRLSGRTPVPVEQHAHVRRARAQLEAVQAAAEVAAVAPKPASDSVQSHAQVRRNITDPDSRLMPTAQGGWVQGFNAQLAVTDDQIIIGVDVVSAANDTQQLIPMMATVEQAAGLIISNRHAPVSGERLGTIVADAGYLTVANLTAEGPDRLIALGKNHRQHRDAREHPTAGPPPPDASPIEQMAHRLRTPEGHELYRRRGVTVEPVNAHLKDRIGLRRLSRRGLPAARSEVTFAATVANLLKIYRAQTSQA